MTTMKLTFFSYSTGAMSYGSISAETHETIALAMNRYALRSPSHE